MRPAMQNGQLRLDAGEAMWLKRELEYVDKQIYEVQYEENIARQLIPTQPNIPDWASTYVWSELTAYGKAKIVSNMSDDIPRVGGSRAENSKNIKVVADAYAWTIFDIKRAAAQGIHLDTLGAMMARRAIETEIDRILAVGDAANNLDGILKLDTVGSITPTVAITKTGGGTNWSAAATSNEIAGDIVKLINAVITKLKGARNAPMFRKFRVVVPDANYLVLATRKMGEYDSRTILEYLMAIPYVESVVGWHHAMGAAANGVDDRIAIYPPDPTVVAGIIPMEFTPQEPEKRNLEYVVDCVATCGGVVARYPMAIGYLDAIDVV